MFATCWRHLLLVLVCGLALFGAVPGLRALAHAEVLLPNGEYTTSSEDLRVKVLGGYVTINRTWANSQWYVNPAWADLKFTYDNLDGSVKAIDRGGAYFVRAGSGVYVFDRRFFIKTTAGGYQWADRQGNSIDYDSAGKLQSYADRTGVRVSFTYNGSGQRSQVRDHLGTLVLSFGYTGNQLTSITDRTGRSVQYRYAGGNLDQVLDVLGNSTRYTYNSDGQLLTLTDAEGRLTTLSYAVSIPAPVGGAGLKVYSPKDAVVSVGAGISSSGTLQTYKVARIATLTDPLGKTTTWQYAYDRLTRQYTITTVTPTGARTVGLYSAVGRMLQQTVGSRTVAQLGFDLNNVEINIDERGLATTIQYDSARNPLSIAYPDGTRISTSYDPVFSLPLLKTDTAGVQTKYDYDSKGNLLSMIEALGLPEQRVTTATYDAYGQLQTRTRKGATTADDATVSYQYDNYGNVTTATDALSQATTFTHDVLGNVLTRTDARSNTTTMAYNAAGWPTSVTDALSHSTTFDYDKVGNRTKVTDALNYPTTYTYDGNNRLLRITDALGGLTKTEYDADGRRTKTIDPVGVIFIYGYDADGRLTSMADGNGNVTGYEYGPAGSAQPGLLAAINYPTYREEFQYDARDRIKAVTQVLNATTRYSSETGYDSESNVVSQSDALGRSTLSKYDALNRLLRTTDALGGSTSYNYNPRDNLLSVTDASGSVTSYSYDRNGRTLTETRPQGEVTRTAYDAVGNLTTRTDAKGQQRRYTYDAANRRTREEHYPLSNGTLATTPSQTITFSYDERNQLIGYNDGVTSASYTFDALNRKTAETVSYGAFSKTLSSDYFANGRRKTYIYADASQVSYTYDLNNQLKSIVTPGGTINYTTYQWRSPTQITVPGLTKTMTYDPLQRVTAIKAEKGSAGSGPLLMDYRYTYDPVSNISSRQTQDGNYSYGYDNLDRLTQATPPANLNLPNEQYGYDAVHNRVTSAHQPGTWVYNANHQLRQYGSGEQTVTLQYDADGHTSRQVGNSNDLSYQYNVAERLTTISDGSGTLATYQYDPFGRRISKQANGQITLFQYSDEGLVAEYDQNGNTLATYGWQPQRTWGTNPQFKREGSNTYFYATDNLGTAQLLTGGTGNAVWRAKAEAFGKTTVDPSSTVTNNLRFPGQYFDQETGSHYNYFRDYDPTVGRYNESDPIGLHGGLNTYGYASNSPTRRSDVYGLSTYMCMQPLHACGNTGQQRCFFDIPGNPFYHQFLCVIEPNGNTTCGGQDRTGNPFSSAGKPSEDYYPFNRPDLCEKRDDRECVDNCVQRRLRNPERPRYGIPFGTDCQEWSDDVLIKCQNECKSK